MKPDSTGLVALDGACVVVVSAAIALTSEQLAFMTVFVPTIVLIRFAVLGTMAKRTGVGMAAEIAFFAICVVLGGFNDWNSVCRKGIYDYTVPHYVSWSTIPLWMLLYWGVILRFLARVARWEALGPPEEASNRVGVGRIATQNAAIKVLAQLGLVAATRIMIYRHFMDPVLSWIPFLAAIGLLALLFKPTRHDLKIACIVLLGGTVVEVLYINVGNLHHYHLSLIGGVPLWIVLWWTLGVSIWKDLAFRMENRLRKGLSRTRKVATTPG